ncbi:hypothetical protein LCGC14_2070750 [marine sediment metagenome]|uniref:Uncharacterized protein n=1 Tax=marine sediment metagenome TaxID=412755 RepID=A0A0F9EIE6_9ZZZZ
MSEIDSDDMRSIWDMLPTEQSFSEDGSWWAESIRVGIDNLKEIHSQDPWKLIVMDTWEHIFGEPLEEKDYMYIDGIKELREKISSCIRGMMPA